MNVVSRDESGIVTASKKKSRMTLSLTALLPLPGAKAASASSGQMLERALAASARRATGDFRSGHDLGS